MSNQPKQCKHPACTCPVSDDDDYCGAYCKDAGDTTEIACNCGHGSCNISQALPEVMTGGVA